MEQIQNLTKEDLNLIQEFTDMYEQTEQKYNEYNTLCESVRKNIIYQNYEQESLTMEENYKNIIEELTKNINKEQDQYRKKLLIEQRINLINQIDTIKKYKPIEETYTNMYYGNIEKYFEIEPVKEKATVVYNMKDELKEKEYYYNQKSTIRQIYVRLKYIYDFYTEYYINKKDVPIDFEFLNNNLKFYRIFKNAIKKYIKNNKEKIEQIINSLTIIEEKEYIQRTK
jgi:hypothetical protein